MADLTKEDVIEFIADNVIWRKLDTGRIKGDFKNDSNKAKLTGLPLFRI